MAFKTLKTNFIPLLSILGIVLMGMSMLLLTQSTKSSGGFQEWQGAIFLINFAAVLILTGLILVNVWRLYKQYKQRVPGTRLTISMLLLLLPLVLIPLCFMFYFSMQFSNDAVDSWFNVDVEEGLQEALYLSQSSLNQTKEDHLAQTYVVAQNLLDAFGPKLLFAIDELRIRAGAHEMTVYGYNGEVLANSLSELESGVISILSDDMKFHAQQGNGYVGLDNKTDGRLVIKTAVKIPRGTPIDTERFLLIEYTTSERVSQLAQNAEKVINSYNQLTQLRKPLKQGFSLALGLAFLVSMLAAVWASFNISRRLVKPIQTLALGTQAVAAGDYEQQLSVQRSDEIGFLTQSFNAMTKRLADAREQTQKSRLLVENERANLAAILSRLSTGVISFDHDLQLRRANHAADDILGCDLEEFSGQHISEIKNEDGLLGKFLQACRGRIDKGQKDWREEFALSSKSKGRRVLVVACSVLAGEQEEQGIVIVFDDVTRLIRAQRDAAWGEVARRLAHEIKNPLTPIQLSAERLRYRYLDRLPPEQREVMDQATQTIISQVESMKNMVNAFRDYARAPDVNFESFDLSALLREIVLLYKPRDQRITVYVKLPESAIIIDADRDRIRQIMHNLFSNAYDALNAELEDQATMEQTGKIWLVAKELIRDGQRYVELELADTGGGFNEDQISDLFEPYVTTKPKGTGLGLAIVRKLVDEHHGDIQLANHYLEQNKSGALVTLLLPADEAARLHHLSQGSYSRYYMKGSKSLNSQKIS